jgi:sulfur carrier protein ThiS adenylyltransferase
MKIGIAGAGGIGSNVAVNLVRYGISDFVIADFDIIEPSNLNRQFYFYHQIGKKKVDMLENNLKLIKSDITLKKKDIRLTKNNMLQIFTACDVVVDGFDKSDEKKLFIELFSQTDKLVVSASGIAGQELDKIKIKKMGGCYIAGDFESDIAEFKVFPPKIQIVAAIMSNIIIKKRGG